MSTYRTLRTHEIGEAVGGPFGSKLGTKDYRDHGVPVIRGSNLAGGEKFSLQDLVFVSEEKADELAANLAVPGDIVITQRGTLGQVGLVPPMPYRRYVVSQSQMRVRPDPALADSDYLYYMFQSAPIVRRIKGRAIATGVPHINLDILRSLPIELPKLPVQRAVARVLSGLDAKIELNRRTNRTLEALAESLFRSWFVEFDPVVAKADAREPFGMEAATAALFPDAFVDSELGPIPEAWGVSTVGEEYDLTMGQSPPGTTYNEEGLGELFFQGRTDFGFRFPTPRVYCTEPKRFAEQDDTLVSVRAPVGDVNRVRDRCCIGRGLSAVCHSSGLPSYTYYSMRDLRRAFERFEAEGTIFGSMSKKKFSGLKVVSPDLKVLSAFDDLVRPLDERVRMLTEESETLAALRDLLLPKLVSGEIRIEEAEDMVEANA